MQAEIFSNILCVQEILSIWDKDRQAFLDTHYYQLGNKLIAKRMKAYDFLWSGGSL